MKRPKDLRTQNPVVLPLILALIFFPLLLDAHPHIGDRSHIRPASFVRSSGEPSSREGMTIEALTRLGETEIHDRKLEDAAETFREIIAREPQNFGAVIRPADIYSWSDDFDRAHALYKDVVVDDTLNLSAWKGLGKVLRWAGRYDESELAYNRVLSMEPEDIDALAGLSLLSAQRRHLEQALGYIDRALRRSPHNSSLLIVRGDILTWSNRYKEAEQTYLDARTQAPESPEVHRSLGNMYKWSGRYEQSVAAFTRAHKLDPRNVDDLANLAETALEAGMLEESELALREMFSLSPDDPRTYRLIHEIETRGKYDYRAILEEYVKPLMLITTVIAISVYFHRRRALIIRRHRYFWKVAYQIFPSAVVLFIVAFAVSRQSGYSGPRFSKVWPNS